MAEPAPLPTSSGPMEGITSAEAPTGVETISQQTPAIDEYSCETLYIQNLNEKIKPEGRFMYFCKPFQLLTLSTYQL